MRLKFTVMPLHQLNQAENDFVSLEGAQTFAKEMAAAARESYVVVRVMGVARVGDSPVTWERVK